MMDKREIAAKIGCTPEQIDRLDEAMQRAHMQCERTFTTIILNDLSKGTAKPPAPETTS